jgi:glycolate oxidase FAD binding subunit
MNQRDDSERLVEEVASAIARRSALAVRGGDSKSFLSRGRPVDSVVLDTRSHCGIVRHEPTELVITARAGTPVAELSAVLDGAGQMLACEPPEFGGRATIGGAVASGLSGPRRPWAGAMRDFVLGCRLITGEAKHLRFGGEVMKNVAGYDMSRLAAGSFGCLGLITEVSLKVLPKPRASLSLMLDVTVQDALSSLPSWRQAGVPVTGACHVDGRLYIRLEGGEGSVASAHAHMGGESLDMGFWTRLREFQLPFFDDSRPLWRLSLPGARRLGSLPGDFMLDWGGAQCWLKSTASSEEIRALAQAAGGHATRYTPPAAAEGQEDDGPFTPLSPPLARLHRNLKARLDPHGIFNPGRLYAGI